MQHRIGDKVVTPDGRKGWSTDSMNDTKDDAYIFVTLEDGTQSVHMESTLLLVRCVHCGLKAPRFPKFDALTPESGIADEYCKGH